MALAAMLTLGLFRQCGLTVNALNGTSVEGESGRIYVSLGGVGGADGCVQRCPLPFLLAPFFLRSLLVGQETVLSWALRLQECLEFEVICRAGPTLPTGSVAGSCCG